MHVYLTKYASKSEPKSSTLKYTLQNILHVNQNSEPSKIIRKFMIKALGERDVSAQETMHHLLSLKLYSSPFRVVLVSLDGSHRVKTKFAENDRSRNDSLLDVYSQRQQFSD